MTNILIAGMVGLLITLFGTPRAVRVFRKRGWGQLIREEGPKAHYEKHGTPTMGGLVILAGTIVGYVVGHIGTSGFAQFRDSGVLALGTIVAEDELLVIDAEQVQDGGVKIVSGGGLPGCFP